MSRTDPLLDPNWKGPEWGGGATRAPTIAARPTVYRGIQMRSRLEATAAATLDEMGVDWRYEARCFAARMGQYLPDFELAMGRHEVFLEVKPESILGDVRLWERTKVAMSTVRYSVERAHLWLWVPEADYMVMSSPVWSSTDRYQHAVWGPPAGARRYMAFFLDVSTGRQS